MREIIFKAKRLDNGEWIFGNLLDNGLVKEKRYFILPDDASNYDEYEEVDPKTVCQYTGLTDKNGKKIFEGDKIDAWIVNEGIKYHIHCLIFWDENELCYMVDVSILQDKSDTLWLNEYKSEELELTGKNINDELES